MVIFGQKRLRQIGAAWSKRIQEFSLPLGTWVASPAIVVCLVSLGVTTLVGGIEQLGGLEDLELRGYDWMMRLRSDEGIDEQLLIVGITEADLEALQQTTPSDQIIAQALATLEQYQPAAIGLDLYRNIPHEPGTNALHQQLQSPRLIAITELGTDETDRIPPPPTVPADRVGFNDLLVDPDGVVRRNLLFGGEYASFSILLAFKYLESQDIAPTESALNPEYMQLGDVTVVPLDANSGGYQTNDARGYQILLNYRSRQVAERVTLSQVLRGELDAASVQGKIVLIGTTAPSSKDFFHTPYTAGDGMEHRMPGVEIHAQMVSQILGAVLDQRSLFWFMPEWGEWLWLGGWAIVGSLLAWRIRHPVSLFLGGVGVLVALSGISFVIFMQAGWVPVVAPAMAMVMASGIVVTCNAQQARRQHQMIMRLLGQNASKEIANALWDNRDRLLESGKLPGQRLIATMLFTDIRGFSTIAEQMPPEALLDWLNEYLEAMTDEIQNHQGIINKFTGDGLLAVFGVPVPRLEPREVTSDAYQAVVCALAMGDRVKSLNQHWQQRGLPPIQMRVGIFTGPVVVGSLGGKDRLEYGVIGDSVNVASRLESCAKERQNSDCRILIASETLIHLQDQFRVEAWGPMALKGKNQMIEVYRVLGYASD